MADYFTHFSCLFDVGSAENAALALAIDAAEPEDSAGEPPLSEGFLASVQAGGSGAVLWLRDDANGDPERLIQFVKLCAAAFALKGRWGFQYANTCSQPRLDGFGGGAHVLDLATGETIGWTCTEAWLVDLINDGSARA